MLLHHILNCSLNFLILHVMAIVFVAKLCPTLCNPRVCSPPGFSVHEVSQQECWSGLPFLSPGDLPNPKIKLASPASPALAGGYFAAEPPGKPVSLYFIFKVFWLFLFLFITLSTLKSAYLFWTKFFIRITLHLILNKSWITAISNIPKWFVFPFFKNWTLFTYLFLAAVGLHGFGQAFLELQQAGITPLRGGAQASHCGGSSCWARALGAQAQ